ncbi:MAG: hypothetical protein HQM13_03665 [SAR324 cluster bacterium]|nr:hypothetical protein [SAR324 cluster bacterium]
MKNQHLDDLWKIIKKSKNEFDLTNDSHYQATRELADFFIEKHVPEAELWQMLPHEVPLQAGLGAMLAISKLKLEAHKSRKMRIGIIINLVHEHHRLLPFRFDNPNGENSLRNKILQLKWIFQNSNISWDLIYVTGGCPWKSENVFQNIVESEKIQDRVHLFDIREHEVGADYIKNQKGGEVIFGAKIVTGQHGYPNLGVFDKVLFTDADMTFDLGQIGNLVDLQSRGKSVLIGSRVHEKSILVKNPVRAGNGILMFRHIQRRLEPHLFEGLGLLDTQCPWKFFSFDAFQKIVPLLDSMDWSIDTDFISAAMHLGYEIGIVPVTAIDSDLESHGHAVGHHIRMFTIIQGILHQAKKFGFPFDPEIESLVRKYIQSPEDLEMLLGEGVPVKLLNKANHEFGKGDTISSFELEQWFLSLRKKRLKN